ncbi:UNVERIFIED_CONTAM: hypothetical protein GTU68_066304 [Idotea baltica]|nr:hypothetical protein [Idotea baltica]
MAGIAEILHDQGYRVSGSDLKAGVLFQALQRKGITTVIGHDSDNLESTVDIVVVSTAISESNPELLEAQRRNLLVIPRAEMLAELMRMKYGIAVAGAHGKTTTTSMTAAVLSAADFDPTVVVGGRVLSQQTGASFGSGKYLVAEADESDGSFRFLKPAIAVVTNIDAEHLSHYGSFGAIEDAFVSFMNSVPFYGLLVLNAEDDKLRALFPRITRRICTYGIDDSGSGSAYEVSADELQSEGSGYSYRLRYRGEVLGRVSLPVPGRHMVSNSLAAAAVALELGADPETICSSLASFPGVSRRMERLNATESEVLVVDDYGHHPTEIRATRREAFGQSRLLVIFEPHRYSRTKELFSEFVSCFDDADQLLVGDIYPAGEEAIVGINSELLTASIQHESASYVAKLRDAVAYMEKVALPGDVVLCLGAGAISSSAHELAELLKRNSGDAVAIQFNA